MLKFRGNMLIAAIDDLTTRDILLNRKWHILKWEGLKISILIVL